MFGLNTRTPTRTNTPIFLLTLIFPPKTTQSSCTSFCAPSGTDLPFRSHFRPAPWWEWVEIQHTTVCTWLHWYVNIADAGLRLPFQRERRCRNVSLGSDWFRLKENDPFLQGKNLQQPPSVWERTSFAVFCCSERGDAVKTGQSNTQPSAEVSRTREAIVQWHHVRWIKRV